MGTAGGRRPYVAARDGHQRLDWIGGMELAIVLDGATTGDQVTVVEASAARGDASPQHVHTEDDEAFLVLEGSMTVWVGDERHQLHAGGVGYLPRSIPHAFRFDTDGRALIITTPSGQENFFRGAGWDLRRPKPDGWVISTDALGRAAASHGTRIVGPPHGPDD